MGTPVRGTDIKTLLSMLSHSLQQNRHDFNIFVSASLREGDDRNSSPLDTTDRNPMDELFPESSEARKSTDVPVTSLCCIAPTEAVNDPLIGMRSTVQHLMEALLLPKV